MFIYWKVVINAKNTIYKVLMISFIKCLCEALFESLIKLLKKEISPTINISSHRKSLWNIMLIVLYWRPNPQGKRKDMKMEHHFIYLTVFTWYIAFFFEMFIWFLFNLSVWYISHWFGNIEKSLHPWNKSHLIVLYDPFSVLLVSDCYWFVEDFSLVILVYKFIDFFVVLLSGW